MFKKIKEYLNNLEQKKIERLKRERIQAIADIKYFIVQESITCRCKGMAVPVFDASNKYHCMKCNSRFANSRHHLYNTLSDLRALRRKYTNSTDTYFSESLAREYYEIAVNELKHEK